MMPIQSSGLYISQKKFRTILQSKKGNITIEKDHLKDYKDHECFISMTRDQL